MTTDEFIEQLRALDFYKELRSQGSMTSSDVCDACEIVENKIEVLIKKYLVDRNGGK